MKRIIPVIMLGALVLAPAAAQAAPLGIGYEGAGKGQYVLLGGNNPGLTFAGELNWLWDGTPPTGWDQSFYSYCVDLTQDLNLSQQVEVKSTTAMGGGGSMVSWLVNEYAAGIHNSADGDAAAAGLQLAIWETLYDPGFDLMSGTFRVALASTAAINFAKGYLNALQEHTGAAVELTWLDTKHGQDQVALNPVPEPGTLLLLGSGVAALAARRRRARTA